MMVASRSNIHVAILIYDEVLATSITLPIEMLKAGEAFGRNHLNDAPRLNISLYACKQSAVTSRSGIKLFPDRHVTNKHKAPDFIIVPSLWRNPRPIIKRNADAVTWLSECWHAGSTIIGVGTGVCFMAESGLLNGHSATTHWHYVAQFKRSYPNVNLKPDFFITQSERIYSAASLNALADIIVHVISQLYGKEAAQNVERNFSHEIRKPYEEQRYLEGAVDKHPDELIAQIQFWMQTNLAVTSSIEDVASMFDISHRSLIRRFKQATGISAQQFWQNARLEAAKELLASSNLSIQEIAFEVSYQDQSHFARVFKKHLNMTPREYRVMVRKKLFSQ